MASRRGGLVRERRRRRGLPVPVVDLVLPGTVTLARVELALPEELGSTDESLNPLIEEDSHVARARLAGGRMTEAWLRLEDAERRGETQREVRALEALYLHEAQTYAAAERKADAVRRDGA